MKMKVGVQDRIYLNPQDTKPLFLQDEMGPWWFVAGFGKERWALSLVFQQPPRGGPELEEWMDIDMEDTVAGVYSIVHDALWLAEEGDQIVLIAPDAGTLVVRGGRWLPV